MLNATINRIDRRGPSARPAPHCRASRGGRTHQPSPVGPDSPAVIRARRRILEDYYDNDEILSVVVNRLIDIVADGPGGANVV